MVKITIIGWYGTETIGDRAILAGLVSLFSSVYNDFQIQLGSIYPFFTERSLLDDFSFMQKCSSPNLKIILFDTQKIKELDMAIQNCDMIVMGGGPLMGMYSLYMVEYAFEKARKLHKRAVVLGCGVGPMRRKIYERSLVNIMRNIDLAIFRDEISASEYNKLSGRNDNFYVSVDPSVFAAMVFKCDTMLGDCAKDKIIACLREFPIEYKINKKIDETKINNKLLGIIKGYTECQNKEVLLLPMHTFAVGTDDRVFLNSLHWKIGTDKVSVENNPLTLEQCLHYFSTASFCIGMRYHSIVLQTILNGRNIILDYTDPNTGKTGNFIKQIDAVDAYKNKYINLQLDKQLDLPISTMQFTIDPQLVTKYREIYVQSIKKITL